MRTQKRRDTKPEVELRRELHRLGYRYFVDRAPLPGSRRRADIVFPRLKIAVYVDGCFWHHCPEHGTIPKTNRDWWIEKLDRNVQRDRDADTELLSSEWRVIRIWEHEDLAAATQKVQSAIEAVHTEPFRRS